MHHSFCVHSSAAACVLSRCRCDLTCRCSATLWSLSLVPEEHGLLGKVGNINSPIQSESNCTPHHVTEPWAMHSFYTIERLGAHRKPRGLVWGRKRMGCSAYLACGASPIEAQGESNLKTHVGLESRGKGWVSLVHTGKRKRELTGAKPSCVQNPYSTTSAWIRNTEKLKEGSEQCTLFQKCSPNR